MPLPKHGVPCIDLSAAETVTVQQIRDACINFGFFCIVNHGVDKQLTDNAFQLNKDFFALPTEEKLKLTVDENLRGYTAINDEHLDKNASRPDTKEGFYIGREMPPDDPRSMQGPNQWPNEELVPNYKSTSEEYIRQTIALGLRLIELTALSLRLPRDFLNPHFLPPKLPVYFLRPLHYMDVPSSDQDKVYACDFGMLTLLKTSEVTGLQVKLDDEWVPVDPPADSYIINLGDMAQRWTNNLYRSTLHRVMTDGRERYSLPLFFDPDYYTPIECLPTCQSAENPAKFPSVKSGEYTLGRYADTHNSYESKEEA